jgi:hypothetical protein
MPNKKANLRQRSASVVRTGLKVKDTYELRNKRHKKIKKSARPCGQGGRQCGCWMLGTEYSSTWSYKKIKLRFVICYVTLKNLTAAATNFIFLTLSSYGYSFGREKLLLSISEKMDGINMKPSIINIENAIVV